MKIVMAQVNPIVGDLKGNLEKILAVIETTSVQKPDLIVFPELAITGYPPRDLLEREWLIGGAQSSLDQLCLETADLDTGVIVGLPLPNHAEIGRGLYNSAVLIYRGRVVFKQHKQLLPTYDVFDEERYFDSATESDVVTFKDESLGISICEDAWNDPALWRKPIYRRDPVSELAAKGATLMVNISASPYHVGKEKIRRRLIENHAAKHQLPFVFVNQAGGNDELIFDGRSMVVDASGKIHVQSCAFCDDITIVDTGKLTPKNAADMTELNPEANMFHALVLGVRDYVTKCGFNKVLLGLSGGIDSALVAALAVEALGPDSLTGITMPGPFSSGGSVTDSRELADRMGFKCHKLEIGSIYQAFLHELDPLFAGTAFGVAEENIQARTRGNLLMALSNKTGALVLTTGNKSEMAVGYCTLYGDMSGGLSVLSDVPKTWVYRLAEYYNSIKACHMIPREIIEKAPSAELRPDQKDEDSLPPYHILDGILELYVDHSLTYGDIIARGYDEDTVRWVIRAVDRNEYKRRQAAPGLKVTSKAFGVGRRMPVAARGEF